MLRKRLLMPFMGFLSGLSLCFISSCGNGPKVIVYISDPTRLGMEYYNENTGQGGFVPYSETDKFVCLNQTDMNAMLNYCGVKK